MNLYQLKGIIKSLEAENNPINEELLKYYLNLYECELVLIAEKVQKELEKEPISANWFEFLAK